MNSAHVPSPEAIPEEALAGYVTRQRWFGSKSREVASVRVIESVPLRDTPPYLALAFVEVRFQTGTHETYQLPVGFRSGEGVGETIAEVGGWTAYDALQDAELVRVLVELIQRGAELGGDQGRMTFAAAAGGPRGLSVEQVRPIGVEQSNTSVVIDETLILKAYRKLEAGVNPELELLRFLTVQGYPNTAALAGWFEYAGAPMDASLGILQQFVRGRSDGWDFALASLRGEPEAFLGQARRLGEVTGTLHTALASDPDDPSFAPEDPSTEALALLAATVDEEIERLFAALPDGLEALQPIAHRGEEVRDRLRQFSHIGPVGRVIRHHGDYHLGQVLWTGEDWIVLDFEGEPARSLPERRGKRSPLRDVAGMLRSFAYAASASSLTHGVDPPPGWEDDARARFLEGYLAEIDHTLIPTGQSMDRLLAIFELEKAVYELRYELDNRPDWVHIPVAGIERLLASE